MNKLMSGIIVILVILGLSSLFMASSHAKVFKSNTSISATSIRQISGVAL